MVVTTNRAPENLYAHGIHRASALELLRPVLARMTVVCIDTVDFRAKEYDECCRAKGARKGVLCSGAWQPQFLCETEGAEPQEETVALTWGRSVKLLAKDGVAHATFPQLCAQPLSADDYLVLADTFHTLVVSECQALARHEHNEARRFTNLVDAAYEANVKVVVITKDTPKRTFTIDDLLVDITLLCDSKTVEASTLKGFDEVNVLGLEDIRASRRRNTEKKDPWDRYDDTQRLPKEEERPKERPKALAASSVFHPNLEEYEEAMDDGVQGVGKAALGSLQESGFAAIRAVSRLKEMQTDRYLRAHSARKCFSVQESVSTDIKFTPEGRQEHII
jgi:predicted ATPase